MEISLTEEQIDFVTTKVKQGRYADESEVIRDAIRRFESQTSADGDIEALAVQTMMETAKSAQEDVKAIIAALKAVNAAKKEMRDLISKMNTDAATNAGRTDGDVPLDFSQGLGSEETYHNARIPVPDPGAANYVTLVTSDLWPQRITTVDELHAIIDKAKGDLDSMSEMGEMESLRLQMAMDRMSKMMSTLSNLLKKISDTSTSIIQNLK